MMPNLQNRKNILVLGDSHTLCFCNNTNPEISYRLAYTVKSVGGATAQGSVNPNSKSNALQKFTKSLQTTDLHTNVCLQLGEVDCGFVIWYRAHKHGITIQNQLETSLHNYQKFIHETVEKKYSPADIILLSATLPTIKDNTDPSILKGARSEVIASQLERTNLTLEYNDRLQNICKINGYNWVSVVRETLNSRTGIVDDYWLNIDPKDHHLNPILIGPLYEKKILEVLGYS